MLYEDIKRVCNKVLIYHPALKNCKRIYSVVTITPHLENLSLYSHMLKKYIYFEKYLLSISLNQRKY